MATKILVVAAIVGAGVLWGVFANRGALAVRLFGPPRVALVEAYGESDSELTFNHSTLDELLNEYVDEDGWVDYQGLSTAPPQLGRYIESLASAPFEKLGRDEKLALLINAYNAFTMQLILENLPLKSIKDIPAAKRWDAKRWKLAGELYSLSEIEHQQIRPNFREPRVHFALVCAAVGCPPLRNEAYVGERLEEQLQSQTEFVHAHRTWVQFEPAASTAKLTELYSWYGSDFEQTDGSVLAFIGKYSSEIKSALESNTKPSIVWLEYDWSLNSVGEHPPR